MSPPTPAGHGAAAEKARKADKAKKAGKTDKETLKKQAKDVTAAATLTREDSATESSNEWAGQARHVVGASGKLSLAVVAQLCNDDVRNVPAIKAINLGLRGTSAGQAVHSKGALPHFQRRATAGCAARG